MSDDEQLVQWSYDFVDGEVSANEVELLTTSKNSSFGWPLRIAIAMMLLAGISTAVVAQTAPELLEPLVAIPEALFSGSSSSPTGC